MTPPDLTVRFNFRYSPDWTAEALEATVSNILGRHGITEPVSWQLQGEPFATDPGRLIDAVVDAVRTVSGSEPVLSTGGGTSDGRYIAPYGIEVVELGPANDSIHQANEFVRLSCVSALVDMYRGIMERLLPGK